MLALNDRPQGVLAGTMPRPLMIMVGTIYSLTTTVIGVIALCATTEKNGGTVNQEEYCVTTLVVAACAMPPA